MPTTIRSVLFASDLSESSDDVLRAAARIATHAGAELHAVHVAEENAWVGMGGETMMDMQRRIHEARRALTEQIERVAPEQTLKSARLVFGPPYRGIEERAREVAADLIVIGPHRRRAIGDRILGTTADRLIRTSQVPCLVVRGPISLPLRRILVPTDLSEPAQLAITAAFHWAAELGRTAEAEGEEHTEVRVVHVAPQVPEWSLATLVDEPIKAQLHDQVEAARGQVGASPPVRVNEEVLQATSPTDEILRLAATEADLLVMGTHGRGALGRALVGSVTSAVARRAERPVLLVPPGMEVAYPTEVAGAKPEESADILPTLEESAAG